MSGCAPEDQNWCQVLRDSVMCHISDAKQHLEIQYKASVLYRFDSQFVRSLSEELFSILFRFLFCCDGC